MRRHKGFSLLEILVAFAVMAIALTIVLRIFGSGVNAAVVSEDYMLATQIAESLMARTGVETPLQVGETNGVEGNRFYWRIRITRVAGPPVNQARFKSQQQETPPGLELLAVKVRVNWGEDALRQRWLELDNLKLFREQAPL